MQTVGERALVAMMPARKEAAMFERRLQRCRPGRVVDGGGGEQLVLQELQLALRGGK